MKIVLLRIQHDDEVGVLPRALLGIPIHIEFTSLRID
jgi:hypothetical protein